MADDNAEGAGHLFLFIDNSNAWIEGTRVAAGKEGSRVGNDADKDRSWRIKYDKLVDSILAHNAGFQLPSAAGSVAVVGSYYNNEPTELWDRITEDPRIALTMYRRRCLLAREKMVDMCIGTHACAILLAIRTIADAQIDVASELIPRGHVSTATRRALDALGFAHLTSVPETPARDLARVVIVSGDSDFSVIIDPVCFDPLVMARVQMWGWEHAIHASFEDNAHFECVHLDPLFERIGFFDTSRAEYRCNSDGTLASRIDLDALTNTLDERALMVRTATRVIAANVVNRAHILAVSDQTMSLERAYYIIKRVYKHEYCDWAAIDRGNCDTATTTVISAPLGPLRAVSGEIFIEPAQCQLADNPYAVLYALSDERTQRTRH